MGCCGAKTVDENSKYKSKVISPNKLLTLKYKFDTQPDAGVWTSGLTITNKNQIVLCYRNDFKLLIFNTDGDHIHSCEMANRPFNVAAIPDSSKLLVTLPGNKSLQYVNTTRWVAGKEIKTRGFCWGISVTKDHIFVGGDNEIYVMSIEGQHIKSIPVQGNCVRYIHATVDNTLYFTSQNNDVKCINMDGQEIFSFSSNDLIAPAGVTVDQKGYIYVAGSGSYTLHRLEREGDGGRYSIILQFENGIKKPKAICFSQDYSQLFIANNGGKSISIY